MLLIALLISANLGPLPAEGAPPPAELRQLRAQLIEAINVHREAHGLPDLARDPIAEVAAQFQAEDMLRSKKMRHEDSAGRSPMDRFTAYGGKAMAYAENVGWHSPPVIDPRLLWQVLAELDRQMMAEAPPYDGHRRNILTARFSGVGVGIAVGAMGVYMSEDFVGH